jgi:hypothetical protein
MLLNLGKHYVSDFIKSDSETQNRKKYSLDLELDNEIGAVRLTEVPPSGEMWGKYWYRSGTNITMTNELKNIVTEITSRVKLKEGDIWLDIACNDGTLLKQVPNTCVKLGIDPCDDSFFNEAKKYGTIVQDYFSFDSFCKTGYGDKKAAVITTIAMFYDLPDPNPFINDITKILDDNGIWVLQMSYTPLMIQQMAFDNICHEHAYYYSLNSIQKLFDKHGLKIVDCTLNDVNGGSFRVYVQKKISAKPIGTRALRDVCEFRIQSILNYESNYFDISNPDIWKDFAIKIDELKTRTVSFIKEEKAKGKIICGYGASTKGNTLLQYFGLDHTLIDAIAERSPYKFGLKTVGTNIPILSEEEVRNMKPDYMLVLPWHFIGEFIEREKEYLSGGGKFIVPCPKFEIINK